jgi:hypothetical protein
MDKLTAMIQAVAEDYGHKRLADDLGCSYNGLLNQLNPNNDRPISLRKFWQMARFTKDPRLVEALLDEMGMVATRVTGESSDIENEIRELLLDQHEQAARFVAAVREAKRDGVISCEELEEIKRQRHELAVFGNTVMSRIEAMHKNGKAALKAVQ